MNWDNPATIPYCGPTPSPTSLALSWNLDPALIGGLAALACVYALGCARLDHAGRGFAAREKLFFYTGWSTTALALVSPLCPLSVALFTARVGQHMVLSLLAAPLIVLGRPAKAFAAVFGARSARQGCLPPAPLSSAAMFAAVLWFWHAPTAYGATFERTLLYWAMHVSVFGSALWLWHGLLDSRPAMMMHRLASGVISSTQMGLLGALITLALRPLYWPHALTTAEWGLTPLQDQQLGGGIMWVPGCLIFLAVSILAIRPALADDPGSRSLPKATLT